MGASVSLATPSVAVQPGGEATLEVRVRNTGSVVDEFALDVLGDSAAWSTVEPPALSLFPGAEGSATIRFRPPRDATVPPGHQPFGLRARSREDAAGSVVEEGVLDIAHFVEPFAELLPRTSRGSRSATHDLAIDNRGNTRLNAEIEGSDPDQFLKFDIRPPAVVVEPGTAEFGKIRVVPSGTFWRGTPKTRPFQLAIRPEEGAPIVLDGAILQEAILPPWFGRAVAGLIALLIAAILLWLLVLRPTIQTAATEAIDELRDDVNSALQAGGLPTMGPGGGGGTAPTPASTDPGATPDPAATPAPPLIPGLGNPVDGRLDAGAATVTAAGTLFITDLVFSNPNGREGAVVLLRDAERLLELRLENFRDFDLHFVTPIVIGSGQSLNLSLACTGEGPCDPAVFYSGYLRP
jgi:hypothetical protein